MARIIIGGYRQDVVLNLFDSVVRAMQDPILTHLAGGKGLFLRYGGQTEEKDVQLAFWIGPSSAIRFEYDAEIFPELDEEQAAVFAEHLKVFGGIILGTKAEGDRMEAEMQATE
ncbi:hypothetical protein [Arthrobacter sp. Soil763]|uniref:hypothetical protein n=1 Tax=Arthrobacter sp. Soil763 TaxID=1736402 RepID=UPI0006FA4508|nr:hypothetical protein [Arthrobacter sp. Soil763]KRE79921.1 hypothetical protein ASG71_07750 [Arthrobacter sp. Soil763]